MWRHNLELVAQLLGTKRFELRSVRRYPGKFKGISIGLDAMPYAEFRRSLAFSCRAFAMLVVVNFLLADCQIALVAHAHEGAVCTSWDL